MQRRAYQMVEVRMSKTRDDAKGCTQSVCCDMQRTQFSDGQAKITSDQTRGGLSTMQNDAENNPKANGSRQMWFPPGSQTLTAALFDEVHIVMHASLTLQCSTAKGLIIKSFQ